MYFSNQLVLCSLFSSALSSGSVQTVTVGNNGELSFAPDSITAAVGTSVEFVFYPSVHSVTQSSFDSPCAVLADGTGFWSGAFTTMGDGTNTNVFTLTVNDTNPIWFYCATLGHCEAGMAGVINPP
jgi:plastocyanin